MSKMLAPLPASNDPAFFEGFSARLFGAFIQSGREKAARSVEETAVRAGMDPAQWLGVEAGDYLPITRQQLHVVADAAGIEWDAMASIVLLCREAWGV